MKRIGTVFVAVATALTVVQVQAMRMSPVSVERTDSQTMQLVHHKPGHYGGPPHSRGYNGYEGYRYRRHSDGLWYPLAAFGAGAVIGGAIATPPRRVYSNAPSAHSSGAMCGIAHTGPRTTASGPTMGHVRNVCRHTIEQAVADGGQDRLPPQRDYGSNVRACLQNSRAPSRSDRNKNWVKSNCSARQEV